jgi:hypothetical protein
MITSLSHYKENASSATLPRCRIPSRSGAKLFWPTVRIRLLLLK